MTTYQHIKQWVLFLVFIMGAVVITRYCFPIRDIVVTTNTVVEYRDTTILKDTTIYKPYPVEIKVPVEVIYIPEDYDSLKTLYTELHQLYYVLKRYEETLVLDTVGRVDLQFVVSKNSLDSIKAEYSYKTYEKIVTITNEVYQNNWYLYGNTDFNSVGLGIMYTNQKYVFGGGYNFNRNTVQVGAGINISRLWK